VETILRDFWLEEGKSMMGTGRGSKWVAYKGRCGIVEKNDKTQRMTLIPRWEDCTGFGRVRAAEWGRDHRWAM
jgi:hypothetical protein